MRNGENDRTIARGAVVPVVLACLAGVLVGLGIRFVAAGALPEERGSAAAICAFALAVSASAAVRAGTWRELAVSVAGAALTAAIAVLAAGGEGASGAAAVTGGAVALAVGTARLARRSATLAPGAGLVGACVPMALAALVFVADPWIEPRGSGPESPGRAATVYRVSPLAALTSPEGGTGVDWQTRSLLYDGGPEGGAGGLSVVGQYYPSRPPSPLAWGAGALALGALLASVGSFRAPRDTL